LSFASAMSDWPDRGADFNQFSAAAKLAGSGQMFNWALLRDLQLANRPSAVPFGRLPVYAAAFKPLTLLPYSAGRIVWLALSVGALLGFVFLWPFSQRAHLLLLLCLSGPLMLIFSTGQDSAFFLLFAALGLRLMMAGHDFLAGLALALCAAKLHLAVPFPLFLIATRRWKALFGGVVGGAALFVASSVIEGWNWPVRLFELSKLGEFSPAPYKMANLHGLAYWLPWSGVVEAALALFVLLCVWRIARRYPLEIAIPVMLAAGLLVSYHSYVYDGVLLVPCLAMVQQRPFPRIFKYWSILLCVPIVYQFLLTPRTSAFAHAAITGFSLALMVLLAFSAKAWRLEVERTEPMSIETALGLRSAVGPPAAGLS